jgi:predicted  nucleic acid-binding Zn-ribbon protein
MLSVLEKLLILQDRDRQILKLQEEFSHLDPERRQLQIQLANTQKSLETSKQKVKQLESDRKRLELEVDAKKQLIERYSLQQFQTKKNEEYRALAHEIEMCKEAIVKLEDQQLDLMEQAEAAQREVAAQMQAFNNGKKIIDGRIQDLGARQTNLHAELAELKANRGDLADAVEETIRTRYERLLKQKGSNVVVGIQHGVCGGCHMQLSRSTVVTCQADQEVVTCINCGRILYYTSDMDLAVAE